MFTLQCNLGPPDCFLQYMCWLSSTLGHRTCRFHDANPIALCARDCSDCLNPSSGCSPTLRPAAAEGTMRACAGAALAAAAVTVRAPPSGQPRGRARGAGSVAPAAAAPRSAAAAVRGSAARQLQRCRISTAAWGLFGGGGSAVEAPATASQVPTLQAAAGMRGRRLKRRRRSWTRLPRSLGLKLMKTPPVSCNSRSEIDSSAGPAVLH